MAYGHNAEELSKHHRRHPISLGASDKETQSTLHLADVLLKMQRILVQHFSNNFHVPYGGPTTYLFGQPLFEHRRLSPPPVP